MLVTMADPERIDYYVTEVIKEFQDTIIRKTGYSLNEDGQFGTYGLFQRTWMDLVRRLEKIIVIIHRRNEVPPVRFEDIYNSPIEGGFSPYSWLIRMNYEKKMSSDESCLGIGVFRKLMERQTLATRLVSLAGTLYHEARHAEQFWLVICCMHYAISYFNPTDQQTLEDIQMLKDIEELKSGLEKFPPHIYLQAHEFVFNQKKFNPIDGSIDEKLMSLIENWLFQLLADTHDKMNMAGRAVGDPYVIYTDDAFEMDTWALQNVIDQKLREALRKMGAEFPLYPPKPVDIYNETPPLVPLKVSDIIRILPPIPSKPTYYSKFPEKNKGLLRRLIAIREARSEYRRKK